MLVVELRSRMYNVITRHRANFQGYVPLHTVVDMSTTAFDFRGCEIGRTRPIVGISVKHLCEAFRKRSRLKSSPRRGSNRGPLWIKNYEVSVRSDTDSDSYDKYRFQSSIWIKICLFSIFIRLLTIIIGLFPKQV